MDNAYNKINTNFKIPGKSISVDADKIIFNNIDAVKKMIVLQHNVVIEFLLWIVNKYLKIIKN